MTWGCMGSPWGFSRVGQTSKFWAKKFCVLFLCHFDLKKIIWAQNSKIAIFCPALLSMLVLVVDRQLGDGH